MTRAADGLRLGRDSRQLAEVADRSADADVGRVQLQFELVIGQCLILKRCHRIPVDVVKNRFRSERPLFRHDDGLEFCDEFLLVHDVLECRGREQRNVPESPQWLQ